MYLIRVGDNIRATLVMNAALPVILMEIVGPQQLSMRTVFFPEIRMKGVQPQKLAMVSLLHLINVKE